MFKWFAHRQISAFERRFGYDASYMHEIAQASDRAISTLWRAAQMSAHREGLPKDAWHAAKIVAARAEDCGPCTQLTVDMALADGVSQEIIRAIIARDWASLPEAVMLAVRFAEAVVAGEPADALREDSLRRWGEKGLISIAFAITGTRMYPQLKRVLGHAQACQRITIGADTLEVKRAA
ncbi:MAG: carboxymuconolactone decarboxylase family protein [Alphaproteobacteria bacterium]|nr:carboxymuconolactone decarboxylase family protein [Alphaproteobacteria bacterium]